MKASLFKISALAALMAAFAGSAQAQQQGVKIGVLTDMSGALSDISGPGSVVAVQMAIEDFGGSVLGAPITVVTADHQNKPDVGASIARRWLDTENVDVIADVPSSAVGLAIQQLTKEKGKVFLNNAGASADFTGPACSALASQWAVDTYTMANGITQTLVKQGADEWFFIVADYTFGLNLERDARAAVAKAGGRVLGSVKHPLFANDFSSFILQAQGAKAKVVGLANGSLDTVNAIRQAREFGLLSGNTKMVAFTSHITDVHALGLAAGEGITFVDAFYWNRNPETAAWSRRFVERYRGRAPTLIQQSAYSAVTHYLKAVRDTNSKNGATVAAKMQDTPINDMHLKDARIRKDGRVVRDYYLVRVKKPGEAKGEWDLLDVVQTIPGESVTRPTSEGGCPLSAG